MVCPYRQVRPGLQLGESAIAPDAAGKLIVDGLHVPFYLEHELLARHPSGVLAWLRPYIRYYWSNVPEADMAPFPVTLFVVDNEEVEETYARTASRMKLMTLPILVSCLPVLTGGAAGAILASPVGVALREAGAVGTARLPVGHRMRPIEGAT